MKTLTKGILALTALGVSAWVIVAQDAGGPQGGPSGPNNERGPRGDGPPPHPPIAILGAIDANHDGVIDETEIANASAALRSLDKNGDGKLTPDEFLGPRPPRGPGERGPGGQGGPDGPRRSGRQHGRPPADGGQQPDQQPQQ